MKKLLCLILAVALIFSLCCCKSDNSVEKAQLISGKPAAVGDVFKMPKIEGGKENAPVLAEITKQASADDTIIVSGKGFSSPDLKFYIYSQTSSKNGKKSEVKFTVIDDNLVHVVVDKSLKYGIYGIYAKNENGNSNVKFVNKPQIWYTSFTHVAGGETVSVYGENLATDNKTNSNVFLVSGDKYCKADIVYADPYKVSFKIPYFLKNGDKYKILLHNGHGGKEGFCESPEDITFSMESVVKFGGKRIDVTDFGANAKDTSNDDTAAIKKAVNSAKDGDTIYFPKGAYLCSESIVIDKSLTFAGAGSSNSIITTTTDIEGYLFDFKTGPVEFKKLGFYHNSGEAEIKSGFIHIRSNSETTGSWQLYVHQCHFEQEILPEYRSKASCVFFRNISGVIIEDNTSEATVVAGGYEMERIFIRDNNFIGTMYVGPYYGQDTVIITNVSKLDVSNNIMRGKDILKDDTGVLAPDDMTIGRAVVIQGDGFDLYFANNNFEASGLPLDNAGELILLENLSYQYEGYAASFDENTITMPDNVSYQTSTDHIISIGNGLGKYQYRRVTGAKGKTITLDRPWDIIPDKNSYVVITNCYYNVAVYNNLFDGYTNYREAPGATCAIQIYGSAHNLYFTKNIVKNLPEGICATARYVKNSGGIYMALLYWNIYASNTFEECGDAIRYFMVSGGGNGKIPFHNSVGVSIRRNTFKDIRDYTKKEWVKEGGVAINMGQQLYGSGGNRYSMWDGDWIIGVSIENNSFENCEIASVYFYEHQGNTVVRQNTENGGEPVYKVVGGAKEPIVVE